MYREICKRIADDFGVKLSYVFDDPEYYKSNIYLKNFSIRNFMPGSLIIGKAGMWEIFVGIYNGDFGEEVQLSAVLHELGHVMVEYKKYCNNFLGISPPTLKEAVMNADFEMTIKEEFRYKTEKSAWEMARYIAENYNIEWTNSMSAREQYCLSGYRCLHILRYGMESL